MTGASGDVAEVFSCSWDSTLAVIREELNLRWSGVAPFQPYFSLIHLIPPTPSLQDGPAFTYCKPASISTHYQESQVSPGNLPHTFFLGTSFLKNESKIFWPRNFKCDLVPCPWQSVLPLERLGHLPLLTTGSAHAVKSVWQMCVSESTAQGLTL